MIAKLTLRQKLIAILLAPVIALIYFANMTLLKEYTHSKEFENIQLLSKLATHSSLFIHELQKERGLSAGFLSSNGTKFVDKLQTQRKKSDGKRQELIQYIESTKNSLVDLNVREDLDRAQQLLNMLDSKRTVISQVQVRPPESTKYYTSLIGSYLDLITKIVKLSRQGEVTRETLAYLTFLNGKEYMGIERATLNAAFASDNFKTISYSSFIQVLSKQDTFLKLFKTYASPDLIEIYRNKVENDPITQEVLRMEQIALTKGEAGNFGVSASVWFDTITKKIDKMKEVEDICSEHLNQRVFALHSETKISLYITALITTFSIVITLVLAHFIIQKILKQIGGEPEYAVQVAQKIAQGELNTTIIFTEDQSILGAINSIQHTLKYLVNDVNSLTQAGKTGQLSIRVESHMHQGDFKKIVEGLNMTLDTFLSPLNIFITAVEKIARGNIPDDLNTKAFQGDFQKLAINVNQFIEAIRLLVSDSRLLLEAANEGNLGLRANIQQHHGDFKHMVMGINNMLDKIVEPITQVNHLQQALADGNLSVRLKGNYQGLFRELQENINQTTERIANVIREILISAHTLSTASRDISSGSMELSRRTEAQASTLEETSSSMEEIASAIGQNTDNIKEITHFTSETVQVAENGGALVERVSETIHQIVGNSNRIAEIVNIIDSIAFQTNILALNAAVEAARAGEQGRGFAVVATEVRNLAQRSAHASKDIKNLIVETIESVEGSHQLSENARHSMAKIVEAIRHITKIMEEITTASSEQNAGIEQIRIALSQLDDVTQQNAAMVEETAASSQSLENEAEKLNSIVGQFHLS